MAVATCADVGGSEGAGGLAFKPYMRVEPRSAQERASEVVQRTPDLPLTEGGTRITPGEVALIYRIERVERDQLLLRTLGQGVRGWAPASAVVPLNQAESFFTKEIHSSPGSSFALLMRAVVRGEIGDLDGALADFNAVLQLDPKNGPAWLGRHYYWLAKNRVDLALADVNRAIEVDLRYPRAYAARGVIELMMADYDKALSDLNQASGLGSRDVQLYLSRGIIQAARGELDKARDDFNHALRIDPTRDDAHHGIGAVHLLRLQPRKALAAANKAIQCSPQRADGYAFRARVLFVLGDYERALVDQNEAIRLAPTSAEYRRNRGALWLEKGEIDRALADVETAICLDPNYADAHDARAFLLATCPERRIHNAEQAVVSATRACDLTKWRKPGCLVTLAIAYSENGDFDAAVKRQQQAIDLLAANDPAKEDYLKLLERYRAKKPYHHLGLFEELGPRPHRPTP
jgi:tetratricopeptide (TPR) repeat protein